MNLCDRLQDGAFEKTVGFVIKHAYKLISERNVLLNDTDKIMTKWKNYTMRNFITAVLILRAWKYVV